MAALKASPKEQKLIIGKYVQTNMMAFASVASPIAGTTLSIKLGLH